jgi:(p)ppGpp synthase/HD superfamily hydrolase
MDIKELEKIARLCHKWGITSIQTSQYTLSFKDTFENPKKAPLSALESTKEEEQKTLTEEDILLWSSTPA